MFEINGYQAQARDFRDAADRVLARNDEERSLRELGFTALEQGQVSPLATVDGVQFRLSIPSASRPMTYVHEESGTVYETRELVVWLVDTSTLHGDSFHTVMLFGDFTAELGCLVEVEGWDDNVTLADAIETSEYLAEQGLQLTVAGPNGNFLAY